MTSSPIQRAQTDWADEVLNFWFTELHRQQWFSGGATLNEQIRSRFLDVHRMVAAAPEGALLADAKTALAAVIVLDQFSRNMFRGTPGAFANDAKALAIASRDLQSPSAAIPELGVWARRCCAQHAVGPTLPTGRGGTSAYAGSPPSWLLG